MKLLFSLIFLISGFQIHAADFRRGENIDVSGPVSEVLFLSGNTIHSDVQSSNDLFMAGGSITQSGGTADNLFAAGGTIELISPNLRMGVVTGGNLIFSKLQTSDLISAGGKITIDQSHIQKNAILAGGQIDIGKGTVIEGSALVGGRKILFAGRSNGDVEIAGNEVQLSGEFAKNVRVRAQHLVVSPDTRIAGDFLHEAQSIEMSPSAVIQGRNESMVSPAPVAQSPGAQAAGVFFGLLFMIGILLAPASVALIFQSFIQASALQLRNHFWSSTGIGTAAVILTPLILFLLFSSVIGVTVALFALPFMMVAALMAWSIAVYSVGVQLRFWIRQRRKLESPGSTSLSRLEILGWTVLGAFVLLLVVMIPAIGFALGLILFLAGLGSIYRNMRGLTPTRDVPFSFSFTQRVSKPFPRPISES